MQTGVAGFSVIPCAVYIKPKDGCYAQLFKTQRIR